MTDHRTVGEDDRRAPKRPAADEREPEAKVRPLPKRIGEGRDNLRKRHEWFKRRTGSDK